MGRRKRGRDVHGVLVVDKPGGMTSNDVVQKVKRLYNANKAGHTGALDPLATGVLPVCLGEATKFSQYLLDSDKRYLSDFVLGVTTETCDADGEIVTQVNASHITAGQVKKALKHFMGEIEQVPPMYSAIKKDGQPLYKLARQGIEVERDARSVRIDVLDLLDFRIENERVIIRVDVACSKGTYIRSIADDLGRELGVGAHVSTLRRTLAGRFDLTQSMTLERLNTLRDQEAFTQMDEALLAMDTPAADLPELVIASDASFYFGRGQAVMDPQVYQLGDEGDKVRVFCEDAGFLGVGELTEDGRVTPKRLVVLSEQ